MSPALLEHAMLFLGTDRSSAYITASTSRTFHHCDDGEKRAFEWYIGAIEHTELDLRQSSALPMQIDIVVCALERVNASSHIRHGHMET